MATTPRLALPYPLGSDRVMDGDDAMHSLASRIEAILYRGQVTIVTGANGLTVITHNLGIVPVFFQAVPQNSARIAVADPATFTATQATVYLRQISDGAAVAGSSNLFQWFAFG